ncbi:MAG: NADH-quinone oxidoreductase subunit N [Cytophagales bacterium]|nr:MAG: NADH-quinone oxidoreductase subunit N [Cytophagales bacterium]
MLENLNIKLHQLIDSIAFILPEIWLVALFIILIIIDLFAKKPNLYNVLLIGLFVQLGIIYFSPLQNNLFIGMLSADALAKVFKYIFAIAGIVVLLIVRVSEKDKKMGQTTGEFYAIFVAILLGMNLLAMATHLLLIYLSLEIVSIGSYILAVFYFDRKGVEVSLKYVVFGIFSSAIMLYGMSLLYGFSGSLLLENIAKVSHTIPAFAFLVAFVMSIAGFLFKISASPFHIWTPDVYEGAPTSVVAFFSTASKVAGFAVLIRFTLALGNNIYIANSLIIIAIVSMLIGNFAALWQTSFKRLLAYSGIAQAGFVLVGLLTLDENGTKITLFYLVVYSVANLLAFFAFALIENKKGNDSLLVFNGLGNQQLVFGVALSISMFSLVGLPITAGFTAKLLIFTQLWQIKENPFMLVLLLVGLLSTAISLYFYLKIPYYLFFKQKNENLNFQLTIFQKAVLFLLAFALIGLFFIPSLLLGTLTTF